MRCLCETWYYYGAARDQSVLHTTVSLRDAAKEVRDKRVAHRPAEEVRAHARVRADLDRVVDVELHVTSQRLGASEAAVDDARGPPWWSGWSC